MEIGLFVDYGRVRLGKFRHNGVIIGDVSTFNAIESVKQWLGLDGPIAWFGK